MLVHPWTWLGGRGSILDQLAHELSNSSMACLTFDLRGAGASEGSSSFSGTSEVEDVQAAVEFMKSRFPGRRVFFIGYSAGACISGSAASLCDVHGYVGLAYPCGWISSIAFSAHPEKLKEFAGPKLLLSGDSDGFTSESQLRKKFGTHENIVIHILPGVGHFDILGDEAVVKKILDFVTID